MRSDIQVEASASARRASLYAKIAAVIDTLPERFQATDLYRAAGIEKSAASPSYRMMVAAVLGQDFKCESIQRPGGSRYWRKPDAARIKP